MSGLQTRDRPEVQPQIQLPVDPRIAARWVAVRRDQNRRRWRTAVVVLAVVTAATGAWILAHSRVLAVQVVVVRGISHTGQDSVVTLAHLERRPMLEVDAGAVKRRLLALPWVADARVRRHWPTTVTIDIVERSPFAQIHGTAGQAAVVDVDGRVLAVGGDATRVLGSMPAPLPHLDGVAAEDAFGAGAMLLPSARGPIAVLRALQTWQSAHPPAAPAPAFSTTSVTRAADGTISATVVPGPITVVFGTAEQLPAKLIALQSVLAQLLPGAPSALAAIDVRVADAPVLTDGKKSSSVSTT